MENINSGNFRA